MRRHECFSFDFKNASPQFVCSGAGSVSKPFAAASWEIVEVDWDPTYGPTHCCNLMTWQCPYDAGHFDVVWASPDCTRYSIARTTAKSPRNFFKADALVERCLQIIEQLEPKVWFLENPDSGYLKTRAVVADLPFVRLDYCMYGAPYRKRTRIWTNLTDWQPKMCDRIHLVDNKHVRTAQRGGRDAWSGSDRFTLDELHRLPEALCDEIYAVSLGVCQTYR